MTLNEMIAHLGVTGMGGVGATIGVCIALVMGFFHWLGSIECSEDTAKNLKAYDNGIMPSADHGGSTDPRLDTYINIVNGDGLDPDDLRVHSSTLLALELMWGFSQQSWWERAFTFHHFAWLLVFAVGAVVVWFVVDYFWHRLPPEEHKKRMMALKAPQKNHALKPASHSTVKRYASQNRPAEPSDKVEAPPLFVDATQGPRTGWATKDPSDAS